MQRPLREKLLFPNGPTLHAFCSVSTLGAFKGLVFRYVFLPKLTCMEFWKLYLGGIGWFQDTGRVDREMEISQKESLLGKRGVEPG